MVGVAELLDQTLTLVSDAAFHSQMWKQVLSNIVDLTGSSDAQLTGLDDGVVSSLLLLNLDPAVLPTWVELGGASLSNPLIALGNVAPVLGTWRDSEAFAEVDRGRSPLWQEIYEPHGLHHVQGGLVWGEATDKVALIVTRDRSRGALVGEELALFHRVLHAANGALKIVRLLGDDRARVLAGAFDLVDRAAFMLDGFGHVLGESSAAQALRKQPGLFRGGSRKLQLADPAANRQLQAAIHAISGPLALARPVASVEVKAPGKRGLDSIVLRVMRAPPADHQLPVGCSVLVLAEPVPLDAGLSAAERDVMMRLAMGYRAAAIADQRNVSIETVRTQIKAVYGKLGTTSQTELMARLNRDRD